MTPFQKYFGINVKMLNKAISFAPLLLFITMALSIQNLIQPFQLAVIANVSFVAKVTVSSNSLWGRNSLRKNTQFNLNC